MRVNNTVWLAAAVLLGMAASLSAQETAEVFPTGVYPDDVINVQAALDGFGDGVDGTVVLKARTAKGMEMAFDFGQDPDHSLRGRVSPNPALAGAIEFRGETDGDARTVVLGGFGPIVTHRRDELIVRNIEFRGPFGAAISVQESTGVLIVNNVILDVVGDETSTNSHRPIEVKANVFGSLDEITGLVLIRNNEITAGPGYFSQGIALNSTNASVVITGNSITAVNVGIQATSYQQTVVVRDNVLEVAVPRPNFFSAGLELFAGTGPDARVLVIGNSITASNPYYPSGFTTGVNSGGADGGYGDFVDSRIMANEFWIDNGDGVDLYIDAPDESRNASNNVISRNVFHGSAIDGVWLDLFDGSGRIMENLIVLNDFSDLTASSSHLWLGATTRDNMAIVRPGDTVTDLGTNTVVVVPGRGTH